MNFQAIIFDLDGVICHTDMYHYQAWKKIANQLGICFGETENNRLRGISRMESLEIILEKYDGNFLSVKQKLELAAQKNNIYRDLLANMTSSDLPESVRETLHELRSMGLKLAIGSSSKNASFILERIGLGQFFDTISDGNNISQSKPDPEVFLKAAGQLGVSPEDCIVVEDAVAGVVAAHRAGMQVITIGDAAIQGVGDYMIREFSELTELMNNLVK